MTTSHDLPDRKIVLETTPGFLGVPNRVEFRERCLGHFDVGYDIIVDLTFTEMMDSSGVGVLDSLRKEGASRDRRIICCHGNDDMRELFNLCGLDVARMLVPDIGSAREFLAGDPPPSSPGQPTLSLVT